MARLNRPGIRLAILASAASVALAACGGGSSTAVAPAPGTLRVALTDAPACGFDQVNVTVERVRVHRSSSANDNDSGWTDIDVNPARKIDLLSLTNGVIAELGQTPLAAGHYTQIRLLLSPNRGGSPANSVVLSSDGSETPIALDTPSATQSGIKLINGFTVTSNELTDLLLDFDACRSIVQRGNGSYGLKPVITVMPRIGAAIVGYVEAGVAGVSVSAQNGGVVLRATQPNATGQFVLAPVDPAQAPYDIVFTAAGRITSVVTGVPATLNNTTVVSAVGSPVPMPDSDSGAVSGTVQPVQAAPTGAVRALQAIGGVPKVEVAHTNVNATTGAYAMSLPLAAPRLAPYVALPGMLSFSPQSSAAQYTMEASATGYATQARTPVLTVTAAPVTGYDFILVPAP
jgi:hypothetical protein